MQKIRGRILVLLCGIAPSVGACAPDIGDDQESWTADPGRPVFEAEVRPDLASGTLAAEWRVALYPPEGSTDAVAFVLAEGLEIHRLEGEGILGFQREPSSMFPGWTEVVVALEAGRREPVLMELAYSGTPAFGESNINGIGPEWVELSVDSGWHPLVGTLDQEWRGTLRVVLPDHWTVLGGRDVAFTDGAHLIRYPEPQLDVAFVASPRLRAMQGSRITVHHSDGDQEVAPMVLEAVESCADYLDNRYGREDPLPIGTVVLADRAGSAYARLGHIVLSRVDPTDPAATSRFLCHELAHYWARGADFSTVHHWMSEAFAEYVAARFVRERYGQDAFDALIERWDRASEGVGPVWTETMTARGSDMVMYRRAPVLLSRLEARIGADRFDRFLELYMTGSVRTTQELLAHLETVAGPEEVAWFTSVLGSS